MSVHLGLPAQRWWDDWRRPGGLPHVLLSRPQARYLQIHREDCTLKSGFVGAPSIANSDRELKTGSGELRPCSGTRFAYGSDLIFYDTNLHENSQKSNNLSYSS